MNLWEFVKGALLLRPDQLICENGREISYAKMVSLAEDLAFYAGKHSCCAIMCSSELNAAVGLLACFAASVTAVPLSATSTAALWSTKEERRRRMSGI